MLDSIAKEAGLNLTLRSLYETSVCPSKDKFPMLDCVNNICKKCDGMLKYKYSDLIKLKGMKTLKYLQWVQVKQSYLNSKHKKITKKTWQQVDQTRSLSDVVSKIYSALPDLKSHLFRNDYQYYQHQQLQQNLPQDHAIVYADFSQNYALLVNDEIQAAHYTKAQVTIHTMYLIRHAQDSTQEKPILTREGIVIVSDDLKHNTAAVFNFMFKLFSYMANNPEKVGLPKVLHRITDNCGFEYKCRQAFSHMQVYEDQLGVKVRYHFSEPGHGKGPHDGLGATIKHGLDKLVVRDRV